MRNDPFAKLGALDQRLFTPAAKPAAAPATPADPPLEPEKTETVEPWIQASKEPRKQASLEARKVATQETRTEQLANSLPAVLNLSNRPERQNTYAFTADELNRLEDVKIAITRRFDLSVTKNDLVRLSVHLLLEDFEARGAESTVLKRLQKRR